MLVPHLICALLALGAAVAIRYTRPAVAVPTLIGALATAVWNVVRAVEPSDGGQVSTWTLVAIVCVEISSAALFVTCHRLTHGGWRVPPWLWALFVGMPVVVSTSLQFAVMQDAADYARSAGYGLHLVYTFCLLLGALAAIHPRRRDASRHVRIVTWTMLWCGLAVMAAQVLAPDATSMLATPFALLMAWATHRTGDWFRTPSSAADLLDSIGVMVFVCDDAGELTDWNEPGAHLLHLRGRVAERGLDLGRTLGLEPPLQGRRIADLEIGGGTLRTELTVHPVDPLARDRQHVLMFRPTGSSVASSPSPLLSGDLEGHDPQTQTLSRRVAVERVREAAVDGTRVLRVEVEGGRDSRADDLMFVIARRLEARSAELGWPGLEWARLGPHSFVTVVSENPPDGAIPMRVDVQDLGVTVLVTPFEPVADEDPDTFVRRVATTPRRRDSAHGS